MLHLSASRGIDGVVIENCDVGLPSLLELATLLPPDKLSYAFFNNITMKQDAARFIDLLNSQV